MSWQKVRDSVQLEIIRFRTAVLAVLFSCMNQMLSLKIVLALLSYVAENERINIKQRQAERIAVAKAKGVKFGRPPRPIPDNFYEVYQQWKAKKITLKQAASLCEMPETTFFDKAKKFGKN